MHRSQGLTIDTCHHFADGGGRELGYVAASRAREQTAIHVVADDLEQAVDELTRDWSATRRPRWAIDTGTPTTHAQIAINEQTTKQLQTSIELARKRQQQAAAVGAPTCGTVSPGLQPEIEPHPTPPDRGLGF